MKAIRLRLLLRAVLMLNLALAGAGQGAPLRVFIMGNSFSQNATRFLPQLAEEGGHELILGKAETGGCSLQRHWDALEAGLEDWNDPKAKIYGGKSLKERLGETTWDLITLQQYSWLSADPSTYQPYGNRLAEALRKLQPAAEIVIHQTWAYRVDEKSFGMVTEKEHASDQKEMWERSRAAYWQFARDVRARVIPTGDAMWRVDSDPRWGFRPDAGFDPDQAQSPALPNQDRSLHVGYRWNSEGKLKFDSHHANTAGEYLGSLVWYGFLFHESPERLAFVPEGVDPEFAAPLRRAAWAAVRDVAWDSCAALDMKIHLVGDSTMADKPVDPPNPERGWGQLLPLLELNGLTRDLVTRYGEEGFKQLYLHIAPGHYANTAEGKTDDTHLSAVGASRVSELVVSELRRLNLGLVDAPR